MFINNYELKDGLIVAAACKDECYKELSDDCKLWFVIMGSMSIWDLNYRNSFAFIGIVGKKMPMEQVSESGASVT